MKKKTFKYVLIVIKYEF